MAKRKRQVEQVEQEPVQMKGWVRHLYYMLLGVAALLVVGLVALVVFNAGVTYQLMGERQELQLQLRLVQSSAALSEDRIDLLYEWANSYSELIGMAIIDLHNRTMVVERAVGVPVPVEWWDE